MASTTTSRDPRPWQSAANLGPAIAPIPGGDGFRRLMSLLFGGKCPVCGQEQPTAAFKVQAAFRVLDRDRVGATDTYRYCVPEF